jgi:hypothetical protein
MNAEGTPPASAEARDCEASEAAHRFAVVVPTKTPENGADPDSLCDAR